LQLELAVNFSAGKNRRFKNQKPSRAEINAAIYLLQIKSEKLHRSSHNRIIPAKLMQFLSAGPVGQRR
jgi:hypothetical protein